MRTRDLRIYRLKNPASKYLCALCGTEREIKYKKGLSPWNYFQIGVITCFIAVLLSPWFGWKGVFLFPIIWGGFEISLKMLFRKDLPCPHCGFDPVWYCKDVKVARKKVENFWGKKDKTQDPQEKSQ